MDPRAIESDIRKNAAEALRFLAPFFGIHSRDAWGELAKRTLNINVFTSISELGRPGYLHSGGGTQTPTIRIPFEPEKDRDDFTIAHEMGHFFHDFLNKNYEFFVGAYVGSISWLHLEGLANYAGIVFAQREDPVNACYGLEHLAKLGEVELRNWSWVYLDIYRKVAQFIPDPSWKEKYLEALK